MCGAIRGSQSLGLQGTLYHKVRHCPLLAASWPPGRPQPQCMGVIPVESRWLVRRNAHAILIGLSARLHPCIEHVVLMTQRRDGQAVEVKVGGGRVHRAARASGVHRVSVTGHRMRHRDGGCVVFQTQDQPIARRQTQRGGFDTAGGHVAVARQSIPVETASVAQVDAQYAVYRAQRARVSRQRADRWPLRTVRGSRLFGIRLRLPGRSVCGTCMMLS